MHCGPVTGLKNFGLIINTFFLGHLVNMKKKTAEFLSTKNCYPSDQSVPAVKNKSGIYTCPSYYILACK